MTGAFLGAEDLALGFVAIASDVVEVPLIHVGELAGYVHGSVGAEGARLELFDNLAARVRLLQLVVVDVVNVLVTHGRFDRVAAAVDARLSVVLLRIRRHLTQDLSQDTIDLVRVRGPSAATVYAGGIVVVGQ